MLPRTMGGETGDVPRPIRRIKGKEPLFEAGRSDASGFKSFGSRSARGVTKHDIVFGAMTQSENGDAVGRRGPCRYRKPAHVDRAGVVC